MVCNCIAGATARYRPSFEICEIWKSPLLGFGFPELGVVYQRGL